MQPDGKEGQRPKKEKEDKTQGKKIIALEVFFLLVIIIFALK